MYMELNINHLFFGYLKRPFSVVDFSCKLKNGEIIALLGEEGGGKTSLLRVISGLEKQYAGEIFINGKDAKIMSIQDKNISYIPAEPVVFKNKTVRQNFEFLFKTINREYSEKSILETFKLFGFDVDLKTKLKKLSSAQIKVFTIIRSYIKQPDLLLLDDLFYNENEVDCAFIKNAIFTYFSVKNHTTSVIYVENCKNQLKLANKYFYFSYGKTKEFLTLEELKKVPADLFATNFFNFIKKDYSLYFDGYNFYLKDQEIIRQKKSDTIIVKRQIKLSNELNQKLAIQGLEVNQEMLVVLASVNDFQDFSDEHISVGLKNVEIFMFDKNTLIKVL